MRMDGIAVVVGILMPAAALAQTAPSAPPASPGGDITRMSGDAAERWLDRQTNFRRMDEDVEGSSRSSRARPARAKDVLQGLEVRDSAGLVVGTVARVDSGFAVVAAPGGGQVEVDVGSFAKNKQGLLINLPKARIDAMMVAPKKGGAAQ